MRILKSLILATIMTSFITIVILLLIISFWSFWEWEFKYYWLLNIQDWDRGARVSLSLWVLIIYLLSYLPIYMDLKEKEERKLFDNIKKLRNDIGDMLDGDLY